MSEELQRFHNEERFTLIPTRLQEGIIEDLRLAIEDEQERAQEPFYNRMQS